MSLNTVIKIGKLYRQSKDSWQYHDQISFAMNDVNSLLKKKNYKGEPIETEFYEINVVDRGDSFSFNLENKKIITNEDKKSSIYYLNFKANKKDTFKKYLVGDIVYSCYSDSKNSEIEGGNYRLRGQWEGPHKSSFWKCEDIVKSMDNIFIKKFRSEFREHIEEIESLLKSKESIVLHFNFNGKRWVDIDGIVDVVDNILCNDLVKTYEKTERVTLEKYLYKTLGGPTPGFSDDSVYKSRLFDKDEIISLLYANKAAEQPLLRIGNIGILALPHSDNIQPDQVVRFFEKKRRNEEEEVKTEDNVANANNSYQEESDSLFTELVENDFEDIVKFDIVFTKIPSSPSGVFSDLTEISDVEKSLLKRVHMDILKQRYKIEETMKNEFPDFSLKNHFQVRSSLFRIFSDVTKDKKKFHSHILKVIPQIYSDSYYDDPLLLPTFINKVEYNIRNNIPSFNTLKYDFYFLSYIQKKQMLMNITQSKSYALGINLGIMAQQFAAWRSDCPIKSFEKSYVGNLSRRSGSIEDLVKFVAFINEKIVMHNRQFPNVREANKQFNNIIAGFDRERYNKYNFALGFFNSYYGRPKDDIEQDNDNTNNKI
jgi:hypothetical protein